MTEPVKELRRFRRAPVIETVLSIQFNAIKNFSIPYFGLYWSRIRNSFPKVETKPPIAHIVENFERERLMPPAVVRAEISDEAFVRCWFLDKTNNSFIQLQHDRFLYNWQALGQSDIYPRFHTTRAQFHAEWIRFCDFLREEGLETPIVDQCEVTYVNHIEYGDGWDSFGELNKIISPWSGEHSGDFLRVPEKVGLNVRYLLPNNQGRLYVSLQPVLRNRDQKEVLQLSLTARGGPSSSATDDIFAWLDEGRKWVVQGFTDFVTRRMHEHWGREL